MTSTPATLLDLLEKSSARVVLSQPGKDLGLAETLPFPFLAVVGQTKMKTALMLGLINPRIGGILLIGPRGTGKTTAVRGLTNLLPQVSRSICPYGCTEEAVTEMGLDAICPDCAVRFAQGEPLTALDQVRMIELPLNAELNDVVGGINERIAIEQKRVRLERGILAQADQNILYVDEVNLLENIIVNAILDAAAQGRFTVRRGPLRLTYRSRLMLIGSMNPEEGNLRPQIMDRFGLRLFVNGIDECEQRMEVYRRARAYAQNPHAMVAQWEKQTRLAAADIDAARQLLPQVELAPETTRVGLALVRQLQIHSHRAEFTLFEAARAYTAADGRLVATVDDLAAVTPMSLMLRRSPFMDDYVAQRNRDRDQIEQAFRQVATG